MVSNFGSITIRLVLIVTLMWLWLMVHPEGSYACSCVQSGSPSEELADADAVFVGRVVSISEAGRSHISLTYADLFQAEFFVSTFWKGPVYQTMYINNGGPCGFAFEEGVEYLIYAYFSDHRDGLWTGLCTRTIRLSGAMNDLAGLGEGQAPAQPANTPTPQPANTPTPQPANTPIPQATNTPTPDMSETGGGCGPSPHTVDLSFVGLMAGLAWFSLRKRRSE